MSTTTRRTKHPLTNEALTIRSVINDIVDSARLAVLQALRDSTHPLTQSTICETADVTRPVVSDHLSGLHEHGFVARSDSGTTLTAGGRHLLHEIEQCLDRVSSEELAFLTRSDHPLTLLEELAQDSYRLCDVQTEASGAPSKPTIRRTLTGFAESGWVNDDAGQQRLTATGAEALQAYHGLLTAVEQLIEKAPWFQRLSLSSSTVPVAALADAELSVSNPRNPASALSTCLDLYDGNVSKFRCLCSVYNPVLFQAYHGLLKLGVDSEAILDWPTYEQAAGSPGTRYAVQGDRYNHYQPLVLESSETLGIGVYDDRRVAIAAYNEAGSGNHIAMVTSSDERLVNWGIDLYESYRANARPVAAVSRS